jgi:hypothetical protein
MRPERAPPPPTPLTGHAAEGAVDAEAGSNAQVTGFTAGPWSFGRALRSFAMAAGRLGVARAVAAGGFIARVCARGRQTVAVALVSATQLFNGSACAADPPPGAPEPEFDTEAGPYPGWPFAGITSDCDVPYHQIVSESIEVVGTSPGRIEVMGRCRKVLDPVKHILSDWNRMTLHGPVSWSKSVAVGERLWLTFIGEEGFSPMRYRWEGQRSRPYTLLLFDNRRNLIGAAVSHRLTGWRRCEKKWSPRWEVVAVPGIHDEWKSDLGKEPILLADFARWVDAMPDRLPEKYDIEWFDGPNQTRPRMGVNLLFQARVYSPLGGTTAPIGPGESGTLTVGGRSFVVRIVDANAARLRRQPAACRNKQTFHGMTNTHGPMPPGHLSVVVEPAAVPPSSAPPSGPPRSDGGRL